MEVKSLYTLLAIADRGSFAEAGRSLGLSLSAVSQQISSLEAELGIQVFDRSRRPPQLTDSGLVLVDQARELIVHWESMSDVLKRATSVGLLKLGAVHTSVTGLLPLALKRLQQKGTPIDIHLTTGLTHVLEMAVYHRQIDAAVASEPESVRDELEFFTFVEEPCVVITHRDTEGDTDQELLESTPYVRFNRAARVGNLVQQEISRRHIRVRSVMEIDTLEGVIAMVANGLGTSIVPSRGVRNEFPSSIRTLPFGSPPLIRRLGLLVPRDNPRLHLMKLLLDSLREVSAETVPLVHAR